MRAFPEQEACMGTFQAMWGKSIPTRPTRLKKELPPPLL